MFTKFSPHTRAVLQALFVTFLWSTSWVFIKIGLQGALPPLTFAGLRYTLAFICLLPILLRRPALVESVRQMSGRTWMTMVVLGLVYYAANQGAQFVGLALLPATTVNLLLSFAAVVVTLLSIGLLAERPTRLQWLGVGLYLLGTLTYFYPAALPSDQILGILVVIGGVLSNAAATLIGRKINREGHFHPLVVTTISMGAGSLVLLTAGILTQGFPTLTLLQWGIVGWLALVNTAFAFTLWNHTLRTLSAMESSVINNAMLIQIPILAWFFLGEGLTIKQVTGFALAGLGILVVQVFSARKQNSIRQRTAIRANME
ncbi:MAG: EamA family transporter [Chloroflexota bacterium]